MGNKQWQLSNVYCGATGVFRQLSPVGELACQKNLASFGLNFTSYLLLKKKPSAYGTSPWHAV